MNQGVIEEITIEELAEDIEMGIYELGIEYFKVTEKFNKRGKCVYIVRGLHIDYEQEYICSQDFDNIIHDNAYTFMMFLKSCIKSIRRVFDKGVRRNEINLTDGIIIVEYIG